MGADLVALPDVASADVDDARKMLLAAARQGFRAVVMVGIRPNGTSVAAVSQGCALLETLGALEVARDQIFSMQRFEPEPDEKPTG